MSPYKQQIADCIPQIISYLGPKTQLREACAYALLNGGKRLRPAITLMVAKALGNGVDVMAAAMAIECFHTASLVADDMPSMDDDDERRGKPSVHKVYGEAIALLVSYALIAEGYASIARNSKKNERACMLVLENASMNTGLLGVTGGQFLDIAPPDLTLPTLRKIVHKKTVSLFEIAFVSGWLYGGGDLKKLDLVKKAASHFGMAFQIADDLEDMEQDTKNNREVNMANVFGRESAQQMFHVEEDQFYLTIEELNIDSQDLRTLMRSVSLVVVSR